MGDPQGESEPSVSSSPGRPAPRLAGDAEERQWLSASKKFTV